MKQKTNTDYAVLADKAAAGDRQAMEQLLLSAQDMIFSLSLRMLGTFADAEDATQEILLKLMTCLPSFKKHSAFSTWAFRIAVNHLKDSKKHMFAQRPLSFEFYADDIVNGAVGELPDLTQQVDKRLLAEELKLSCTNVMLQCLDAESRCIFVLGTMFQPDSRVAGEILGISPEAYRQKLSRVRKKMAAFLSQYCGAYGQGACRCADRLNYAIASHRLDPSHLDYSDASPAEVKVLQTVKSAMEQMDDLSQQFTFCKACAAPESLTRAIRVVLQSKPLATIENAKLEADG